MKKETKFLTVVGILLLMNVLFVAWWSFKDRVKETSPRPVRVGSRPPLPKAKVEKEKGIEEKSIKEYPKAEPGRFAYLSVCTNVKTLTAVLVQMELLRKARSQYPYVVLVSSKRRVFI